MTKARLESIPAFKKVPIKFGNYKLRYAWVSQRGFYPDEPDKDNQDSHVEVENFCSDIHEDMHLFGVFDGHGKTGHKCAWYARDKLPGELASFLKARRRRPAAALPAAEPAHPPAAARRQSPRPRLPTRVRPPCVRSNTRTIWSAASRRRLSR